jgi:minor extracellular serine protease Vpr
LTLTRAADHDHRSGQKAGPFRKRGNSTFGNLLMKRLIRYALTGATFAVLAACGGGSSPPADSVPAQAKAANGTLATRLALQGRLSEPVLDSRLARAKGSQRVWITLSEPSLASMKSAQMEALGLDMQARSLGVRTNARILSAAEQAQKSVLATHRDSLRARQSDMMNQLRGMGARELGRVHVAHNALAVRVDATSLQAISQMSGVVKVRPVVDYVLDLSETVPYVGGAAVQASGRTGAGVRVAVLDSGIDYTHRNLGGAGTDAAYAAAYGTATADPKNTTRDGLFPTAKVVAGYDFVGEVWPNPPAAGIDPVEAPDEDPIDLEGHGTHVADIIAGLSLDGKHKGMAPNASLLAVKVCSAVATSCSGVALLQGIDFALDPNGDGDTDDAVDVINMSLGSNYGQIEDDLTLASFNAVKLGVVVVASAGNGANKPYVAGSPANGVGVISVAQTQTPSATAVPLVVNAPAALARTYANTETLDWAPIGNGVTGDVVFFGRGCPAGSVAPGSPADPVLTNPSGKIALIDRGACSVSLKVDAAAKAGATGVLIGLVAAGDAVAFSFGGGDKFVPSLVIQQSLSNAIKAQLTAGVGVNVSLSKAAAIPLVGSMASSSSRGPAYSTQHIKPEIGAPGASLSAEAGTGAGETPFGGTSGAAPMVAGAVALLIEAHPRFSPDRIKALLMNSAETVVYTNPALVPGELAPITRIGAGELRVDRAVALTSLAWNRAQKSAALSFGALEVNRFTTTYGQRLRVENFGGSDKVFNITPSFRYASDAASGAVTLEVPSQVVVPAHGYRDVDLVLLIDPDKLPSWTLDGGFQGGNGAGLNGPEYDGYLTLTSGSEKLSVPWHVLPRRAALNGADWIIKRGSDLAVYVNNPGHEVGKYELFSLMATSPKLPRSALPDPGDNFAAVDLRAVGTRFLAEDVCGVEGGCLEFAISTHGRRAHPAYPGGFEVDIDTNGDGVVDYFVYNEELGSGTPSATGQTLVWFQKVGATTRSALFFADADFNSGNMTMTVPMSGLGLVAGTTINFSVIAYDNYFSGLVSDELKGMRFTPGAARFNSVGLPFDDVPSKTGKRVLVTRAPVADASSTESGLLFMHRRNAKQEADILIAR